jgi:hypothetical protein
VEKGHFECPQIIDPSSAFLNQQQIMFKELVRTASNCEASLVLTWTNAIQLMVRWGLQVLVQDH